MYLVETRKTTIGRSDGLPNKGVILKDISVGFRRGEITGVIGPSGAGKSILLRAISGLLPEQVSILSGHILYCGVNIDDYLSDNGKKGKIFYTPQNAYAALNPVLTIKKQIRDGITISDEKICDILAGLNLHNPETILRSYPFQLSEGESQRCILAMAIALKSALLLLDEPVSSLDNKAQKAFLDSLKEICNSQEWTVVIASHNLALLKQICTDLIVIDNGSVIENGPTDLIFSKPTHPLSIRMIKGLSTS